MKKIGLTLFLVLLFPMSAFAAQVFGSLTHGNGSVGEGVEVRIQCSAKQPYMGKTDTFGSYRVYLPRAEKCGLMVFFRGQWSMSYDIYSDETDPVRYDFELIKRSDGALFLRRR